MWVLFLRKEEVGHVFEVEQEDGTHLGLYTVLDIQRKNP